MGIALGDKGPEFSLLGVDGKTYSLSGLKEARLVVVVFSCNHCPYVQAYEGRLIAVQRDYAAKGVQLVAINANDAAKYPDDSFPEMVKRAKAKGYNFPYLHDVTQQVARAYGAERTPHIFVLDQSRVLRYTGRIDDNWQDAKAVKSHDLRDALDALLAGKPVATQTPAIGCTVKWA